MNMIQSQRWKKERVCLESFSRLFERTVDIVKIKMENSEKAFQGRVDLIRTLNDGMAFFLKRYTNFLISIDEISRKYNLPVEVVRLIKDEHGFFFSEESKEHQQVDSSLISLFLKKRRK